MSTNAFIMLIPDSTYVAARPKTKEHHLTIACMRPTEDEHTKAGIARLHNTVQMLARFDAPIPGRANGVGVFNAGQDGFAVVDLIDGIGTFNVRAKVESLFGGRELDGVAIDYTHGFTPHMTREYLSPEDDFYAEIGPDMIDNVQFNFVAIGLWWGDNQRYEVAL